MQDDIFTRNNGNILVVTQSDVEDELKRKLEIAKKALRYAINKIDIRHGNFHIVQELKEQLKQIEEDYVTDNGQPDETGEKV